MSGRAATINQIPGKYALSVGRTEMPAPPGWRWLPLTDVAQLESGHTPSRERREYWDGDVPWIGIKDARIHHGRAIEQTLQSVTPLGIDNSAARILPKGTVCLSRTASVGYVVVMGRPMATSQDFVNWVCGPALEPDFLKLLLIAENESLFRFGKGSTHTTIYYPEVKAFHICLPPLNEQRRIVAKLEALQARSRRAREALDAVPPLLEKLRQSILAAAFRGDLTRDWRAKHPDVEPASELVRRTAAPTTKSSGRAATMNVRPGRAAISVGHPEGGTPERWSWVALSRIARLESGHTPSREHPTYWNGDVRWIGIKDAREHHGKIIEQTFQTITAQGLANSAARLLPAGTVCFSRTASVGYVTIMGSPMATSQDFANWVCSDAVLPEYLMLALMAEGDDIRRFGEGSTHTTIYYPELKAFHVCLAPLDEQREIVRRVRSALDTVDQQQARVAEQLVDLGRMDSSFLSKAFRGELVPQDPNDEPAEVTLARLRDSSEEQSAPVARRRGRRGSGAARQASRT